MKYRLKNKKEHIDEIIECNCYKTEMEQMIDCFNSQYYSYKYGLYHSVSNFVEWINKNTQNTASIVTENIIVFNF